MLLLVWRDAKLRGAFLEFDRIDTIFCSDIDKRPGDIQTAVVVDSNLRYDVGWVSITNFSISNHYFTGHADLPFFAKHLANFFRFLLNTSQLDFS